MAPQGPVATHLTQVLVKSQQERKERIGLKKIYEEIMADIFPNVVQDIDVQIQKGQ